MYLGDIQLNKSCGFSQHRVDLEVRHINLIRFDSMITPQIFKKQVS